MQVAWCVHPGIIRHTGLVCATTKERIAHRYPSVSHQADHATAGAAESLDVLWLDRDVQIVAVITRAVSYRASQTCNSRFISLSGCLTNDGYFVSPELSFRTGRNPIQASVTCRGNSPILCMSVVDDGVDRIATARTGRWRRIARKEVWDGPVHGIEADRVQPAGSRQGARTAQLGDPLPEVSASMLPGP
jgi:hypothetical protein